MRLFGLLILFFIVLATGDFRRNFSYAQFPGSESVETTENCGAPTESGPTDEKLGGSEESLDEGDIEDPETEGPTLNLPDRWNHLEESVKDFLFPRAGAANHLSNCESNLVVTVMQNGKFVTKQGTFSDEKAAPPTTSLTIQKQPNGEPLESESTNSSGTILFANLEEGTYKITDLSHSDLYPSQRAITEYPQFTVQTNDTKAITLTKEWALNRKTIYGSVRTGSNQAWPNGEPLGREKIKFFYNAAKKNSDKPDESTMSHTKTGNYAIELSRRLFDSKYEPRKIRSSLDAKLIVRQGENQPTETEKILYARAGTVFGNPPTPTGEGLSIRRDFTLNKYACPTPYIRPVTIWGGTRRSRPTTPTRPGHEGVDIMSTRGRGTPIYAVIGGVVQRTKNSRTGTYVTIKDKDGRYWFYQHMVYNSIPTDVTRGKLITGRQYIGQMGNTAPEPTIVHLHLGIAKKASAHTKGNGVMNWQDWHYPSEFFFKNKNNQLYEVPCLTLKQLKN